MRASLRPVLAVVLLGFVVTGCARERFAVPEEVCGVRAAGEELSELLPNGERLKVSGEAIVPGDTVYCDIVVDGSRVMQVESSEIERQLPSEDWDTAVEILSRAEPRSVSFAGKAVIGSNGARVTAQCSDPRRILLFNVNIFERYAEDSDAAVDRMQRFIERYVPAVAAKADCVSS